MVFCVPRHHGGTGCQQHGCTRPPCTHRQLQSLFCRSTALLVFVCCAPREREGSCSVGGAALQEKRVPCAAEPPARSPAPSLHRPRASLHHWLLQTSRVKLLRADVKTKIGESHQGKQQPCVSNISTATKSILWKRDLTLNSFFSHGYFPITSSWTCPSFPSWEIWLISAVCKAFWALNKRCFFAVFVGVAKQLLPRSEMWLRVCGGGGGGGGKSRT